MDGREMASLRAKRQAEIRQGYIPRIVKRKGVYLDGEGEAKMSASIRGLYILKETEKAFLVEQKDRDGETRQAWLPKSMLDYRKHYGNPDCKGCGGTGRLIKCVEYRPNRYCQCARVDITTEERLAESKSLNYD